MKNVCLIPCFNRPEYLFVTLNLIKLAENAKKLHYIFALDAGFSPKTKTVICDEMKGYDYEIVQHDGRRFGEMKQSFNVLQGYKLACKRTEGLIYLVEDDIFVSKSFFTSLENIHKKEPEIFCAIGSKLHNYAHVPKDKEQTLNPLKYRKLKASVYQSWGICFKKEIIEKYIIPHANHLYYGNSEKYINSQFKNHPLDIQFREQDGLIRRIIDSSELAIAYPDYPRCYHAGIWSYHRKGENVQSLSYDKKVKLILETCFDSEKMKKYNEYDDVFVSDLRVANNDLELI